MSKAKKVTTTKAAVSNGQSKAAVKPAPEGPRVNPTHEKEGRKAGVRIRCWKKGSRHSEKYEEVYMVIVAGKAGDNRALSEGFTSAAAAKKAALAAGFKVVDS